MEFVPLAIAAATVWKIVSMVKFVTAGDKAKAITQLVTWAAGIGVAFLLAASDFTIEVAGTNLSDLNSASVIFFGLALGSVSAVGYDSLSKNPEPKLMGPGGGQE